MSVGGENFYFADGNGRSRGVAIALKKSLNIEIHNIIREDTGRYIMMYVTLEGKRMLFANIYAPNEDSPEFFDRLHKILDKMNPEINSIWWGL